MHPRDRAAPRTTRAARRCRRCPRGYSLRAMPAIVVPFRGAEGKSRLHESRRMRRTLPRPRAGARPASRRRGDPEPRRRRRHDRRLAARWTPRRATDPGRAHRAFRRGSVVRIAVLSGGVGGARFVRGLVDVVPPADVTVIGNVGDDVEVLGLHVSPDLDSILYVLAGWNDEERGWGRADETWSALAAAAELGGES